MFFFMEMVIIYYVSSTLYPLITLQVFWGAPQSSGRIVVYREGYGPLDIVLHLVSFLHRLGNPAEKLTSSGGFVYYVIIYIYRLQFDGGG